MLKKATVCQLSRHGTSVYVLIINSSQIAYSSHSIPQLCLNFITSHCTYFTFILYVLMSCLFMYLCYVFMYIYYISHYIPLLCLTFITSHCTYFTVILYVLMSCLFMYLYYVFMYILLFLPGRHVGIQFVNGYPG